MADSRTDLDVLVAGAGPVGLTAAMELKRYGLQVRILDQAVARTDKSKALVVWPRTLEHLERSGIAGSFVAAGTEGHGARFYEGGKELVAVNITAVESPYPFALMIPQSETERILEEHLASLGVNVERSTRLLSLAQADDAVTAEIEHPDGSHETLRARWMIGADGAHSTVRHALGAEFSGDTLKSDWALADVKLEGYARRDELEMHLHDDGILAMFPVPPDRVRVIADWNTGRGQDAPGPTLEDIQTLLDERGGRPMRAYDPVWISAFHINERMVAEFRYGNVFLAGDAAHIHSPAGGQGMNTGMQDAFNLAWKIALVHDGKVSKAGAEKLLASYTPERAPIARAVLKGAGLLTRVGTLENSAARAIRNVVLETVMGMDFAQRLFAKNATELAVSYPDSPLNTKLGMLVDPKPGERAPVRKGDKPVSAGSSPRFALYAKPSANTKQLIACYPDLFEPEPRAPFEEDGVWIVRPDGYVGFAARHPDWKAADAYLGQLVWS